MSIEQGGFGATRYAKAIPAEAEAADVETANDRFKRSFGTWFWSSMITATVFHFMIFQFWPVQSTDNWTYTAEELEVIDLLPELDIPQPPEEISRPAMPVMSLSDIDVEITIAPTDWKSNPPETLSAPRTRDPETDPSANPVFTPYTVSPEIKNRDEVQAALIREYPTILRDARIGGTVFVWFFISKEGRVLDRRVSESSGHAMLDQAALEVADVFRFSPALNRDNIVQVWIQFPIVFEVR